MNKIHFNYTDVARDLAAQYAEGKIGTDEYFDLLEVITEKKTLL